MLLWKIQQVHLKRLNVHLLPFREMSRNTRWDDATRQMFVPFARKLIEFVVPANRG